MNEHEIVPADGGSYERDSATGELRLVEPTTAPNPGKSASAPAAPKLARKAKTPPQE